MPGRGREEENLDPLQATKLQLCFGWCSQTWGKMGEVVRGLPWQKREPNRNKKVGKFVALWSAKCSKESPAGTQKHTGASLPPTYTADSYFCLGKAQFLWHQYKLIYSTSEMLNSSWHQEEGGTQPLQMPFSVPQLSTFRSVSLNTLFILPSMVKWLLYITQALSFHCSIVLESTVLSSFFFNLLQS